MPKSRTEAATPSAASALRSHLCSGALRKGKGAGSSAPYGIGYACGLLAGFFELGVELVEDRLGVHALRARLLDPVLDDRPRALLRFGLHLGIGGNDARAGGLGGVQPDLVGLVPALAVRARGILEAVLLDDLLVLRRELVPLALVHEEAERRAVEAAGEDGALADDLVELEGHDRFKGEEHAVGNA